MPLFNTRAAFLLHINISRFCEHVRPFVGMG
jgi:hypothetical protein